MTYYINPVWFYLMNTLNSLRIILVVIASIMLGSVLIGIITWFCNVYVDVEDITNMDEHSKKTLLTFGKIIIIAIASLFISCLIPSKETCVEMMIASQVTRENVSGTREEIYQIIDYVTEKINGEESEEYR